VHFDHVEDPGGWHILALAYSGNAGARPWLLSLWFITNMWKGRAIVAKGIPARDKFDRPLKMKAVISLLCKESLRI
jgi:hypothetical protein